jgi:hypothetical protein
MLDLRVIQDRRDPLELPDHKVSRVHQERLVQREILELRVSQAHRASKGSRGGLVTAGLWEIRVPLGIQDSLGQLDSLDRRVREVLLDQLDSQEARDHLEGLERLGLKETSDPLDLQVSLDRVEPKETRVGQGPQEHLGPWAPQANQGPMVMQVQLVSRGLRVPKETVELQAQTAIQATEDPPVQTAPQAPLEGQAKTDR